MAHNVSMRFKYNPKKFFGHIGQSWNEFVSEYQQVARDYEFNAHKKLLFFHNIFGEDAKRHIVDNIFPVVIELINSEYLYVIIVSRPCVCTISSGKIKTKAKH